MNFTIAKEETYNLIKLGKDTLTSPDKLKAEVKSLAKDNPFFIINCKAVASMDKEGRNAVLALNSTAKAMEGSLIVSELKDDLKPRLEEDGVHCLPTDNEAVDYIFMEQIESQLGDFDDEDED